MLGMRAQHRSRITIDDWAIVIEPLKESYVNNKRDDTVLHLTGFTSTVRRQIV